MSAGYRLIQWNTFKKRYDLVAGLGILLFLAVFLATSAAGPATHRIDPPVLLIRAFGLCAILMLHIVLAIGPACRLWPALLPLLYNRRHLGVLTFTLATVHAVLALGYYHGFGVISPPVSLFTSNTEYGSLSGFPFEILGVAAWFILLAMAATSHDLWLHKLGPTAWKSLHMLVYVAWALLLGHVTLGALQRERAPALAIGLLIGAIGVTALHIAAARRKISPRAQGIAPAEGWIDAGPVAEIPESRAIRVILPGGREAAIYRHGSRLSAISGRCAHQGGPLAEGKIVHGCITCPWHGYQYRPTDGCSPPPFTDKLATYRVKVEAGRVLIDPRALPPGTAVEPAEIMEAPHGR